MTRRQFTPASTLAMCLILAVAGCGGSSPAPRTGTPATGAPPSKPQFIAAADGVCEQFRNSLAQLRPQTRTLARLGDTPKGFALAATVARRAQSLEQAELSRLHGLTLPAGDTSAVTSYLAQGAKAVALVGQLADAFAKADKAAISNVEQAGTRLGATAKGLAQGYGFKVCGHGVAGDGFS